MICKKIKKKAQQFKKPICDPNIPCVNLGILQNKLCSKCQNWLKNLPPLPLFISMSKLHMYTSGCQRRYCSTDLVTRGTTLELGLKINYQLSSFSSPVSTSFLCCILWPCSKDNAFKVARNIRIVQYFHVIWKNDATTGIQLVFLDFRNVFFLNNPSQWFAIAVSGNVSVTTASPFRHSVEHREQK